MGNIEFEAELRRIASKLYLGDSVTPGEQALVAGEAGSSQDREILLNAFKCLQWNGDAAYAPLVEAHYPVMTSR